MKRYLPILLVSLIPLAALAIQSPFGGSSPPPATGASWDPLGNRQFASASPPNAGNSGGVSLAGQAGAITGGGLAGTWSYGGIVGDTIIYSKYTSAATINALAGWYWNDQPILWAGLPVVEFKFRTGPSLAAVRYAVGLGNGASPTQDINPARGCYLRFTAGTDTSWVACSGDGTAGSCEALTSPVAPSVTTPYTFRIEPVIPTSCAFYINGVLKKTKTTNIPPSTQWGIGPVMQLSTLETVAKSFDIGSVTWTQLR